MRVKFLQINIFKGKFLEELVEFIKKQEPDIITMQEVSAGNVNFYVEKTNLFDLLKERLGDYRGVFHSNTKIVDSPTALFGNAVFSKKPICGSQVIGLQTFRHLTFDEFNNNTDDVWSKLSRHMLDAVIDFGDFRLHAISTHFRRIVPPVDNPQSTKQAKLIASHLQFLGNEPFIVGGDFNMPPESEVIKIVSGAANNLMTDSGVKQTLNPRVHELGDRGYLVDFIFTSKHFKKVSLDVPQVTVSDHLPIVAELELL